MIHVQPSLIEPEVQTLEILTQRAVGRVAERAWFVLMSNQGKSVAEICQTFQRGPHCVRKWIKRYNSYGIVGLYDTPRTGRPPKINPQMKPQSDADLPKSPLEKGFFAGFWTLPLLVIHCLNPFTMRLSQPTRRNLLSDLGYRCRRPRLAASRLELLAAEKLSAASVRHS